MNSMAKVPYSFRCPACGELYHSMEHDTPDESIRCIVCGKIFTIKEAADKRQKDET